jgi:hypothetical protein
MFKDLTSQFLKNMSIALDYRPARWESPMEQKLLSALRYMGLGVETQVPVGNHHVDMIVFGRSTSNEVIIECDNVDFHHSLIDEFRDDALIEFAKLPIAHIYGTEIADSSERCALYIAARWFPKIIDKHSDTATLEMLYHENKNHHGEDIYFGKDIYPAKDTSEFFPVGVIRPMAGDSYPSQSNRIYRDYLRFIVGNIPECAFLNDKERKRIEAWKTEFAKLEFPQRTFSPSELARFYILLFYHEPDLSCELQRLDDFLEHRRRLIEIQEENEMEIPE